MMCARFFRHEDGKHNFAYRLAESAFNGLVRIYDRCSASSCAVNSPFCDVEEIPVNVDGCNGDEQNGELTAQDDARQRSVNADETVEGTFGETIRKNCVSRPHGRRKRAHIMGVVVSETTIGNGMATVSVTANSRKRRPTIPGKSKIGIENGDERGAHRENS